MQASAAQISDTELERIFLQCVQHAQYPDLQHEVRFYREGPPHSQTQAALRRRIDKMLYMKEVEEARRAAEKALQDELSLKTFAKKGAAGKGQDPKKDHN